MNSTNSSQHWYCLSGSIWNTEPSVQALSYRILCQYKQQEWALEIMNAVELDESVITWALSIFEEKESLISFSSGLTLLIKQQMLSFHRMLRTTIKTKINFGIGGRNTEYPAIANTDSLNVIPFKIITISTA